MQYPSNKAIAAPRLRLVPNLRLVFEEDRQGAGNGKHQHQSPRRQWCDAIDLSLARPDNTMLESRNGYAKSRKTSDTIRWRAVRMPPMTSTTREPHDSPHLRPKVSQTDHQRAAAFRTVYKPLHFVAASSPSKRLFNDIRGSTERRNVSRPGSKLLRSTFTISVNRTRANCNSIGRHSGHGQATSSPLAFHATTSKEQRRSAEGPRELIMISPELPDHDTVMEAGIVPDATESANCSTISAAASSALENQAEPLAGTTSLGIGLEGCKATREISVFRETMNMDSYPVRSRGNDNHASHNRAAHVYTSSNSTGNITSSEGRLTEDPPHLETEQVLSELQASSKASFSKKLSATFRPSSAVLNHPEIVLGLLAKSGEKSALDAAASENVINDCRGHLSHRDSRHFSDKSDSPSSPIKEGKNDNGNG